MVIGRDLNLNIQQPITSRLRPSAAGQARGDSRHARGDNNIDVDCFIASYLNFILYPIHANYFS